MKKLAFFAIFICCFTFSYAKKVRFACDMTGVPVNVTGMHISGDFQTVAGFPGGDWNSATTSLTQEGTTDIYSIIVDIPAFNKYEYKFVNGDLFYEVEFVPEPSRVGYNFNDNRWIYIDSLANDTTDIGAIQFGQNAPAGLTMVRFFVDMANETVSGNGIHLAGSFQGWNPATVFMYSFGSANTNGQYIHEVMMYVPAGIYEYKFFNGNTPGTEEVIPGICSVNSNREVNVTGDTLLTLVCFASCSGCVTGLSEAVTPSLQLYPNPATDHITLSLNPGVTKSVFLVDVTGRTMRQYTSFIGNTLRIDKEKLNPGLYFISVYETDKTITGKLIFE